MDFSALGVHGTASAGPGGDIDAHGAARYRIHKAPDRVRPTSSPWIYVQFSKHYRLATFACAFNTLRVLHPCNTLALETGGHCVGLASMEAKHQQGECKQECLHVDCECFEVTDSWALIIGI